jgi:hypothetical protein
MHIKKADDHEQAYHMGGPFTWQDRFWVLFLFDFGPFGYPKKEYSGEKRSQLKRAGRC